MTKECLNSRLLALIIAGVMLVGCGGGESTSAPGAVPPGPGSGTGSATLSWTAPSENSDGSAITDLAGYRIYHGTSANALVDQIQVNNPGVTVYVVEGLPRGTNYFAITAYNSSGAESDRSPIGSKSVL